VILDVRGRCPFTDFMVLATARSQQLAQMLAGAVLHAVKARAREVAPGVAPAIEGGQVWVGGGRGCAVRPSPRSRQCWLIAAACRAAASPPPLTPPCLPAVPSAARQRVVGG
jgi:hypothetical protein